MLGKLDQCDTQGKEMQPYLIVLMLKRYVSHLNLRKQNRTKNVRCTLVQNLANFYHGGGNPL